MKKGICLLLLSFLFLNCNGQQASTTISTAELKRLLAQGEVQLLDVRTPKEIQKGAIKTALFANYFDVDFEKVATVQLNKSKPVYLYCKSGNRSGKACKILKDKGFEVINVLGGYRQWDSEKNQ
mgnify:CR=1 FL=1